MSEDPETLKYAELSEKPLTPAQIRRCSVVQSMLHGLFDEYPRALRENRISVWCKAAHSIIDFFESEPVEPPNTP